MAPHTINDFTAGNPVAAADLNLLTSALRSLLVDAPSCRVERTGTAQNVGTGPAQIEFTAAPLDHADSPMWAAGAPTRITIPAGWAGLYLLSGSARFTIDPAGTPLPLSFRVNGSDDYGEVTGRPAGDPATVGLPATLVSLNAGDYVELHMFAVNPGQLVNAATVSAAWLREVST